MAGERLAGAGAAFRLGGGDRDAFLARVERKHLIELRQSFLRRRQTLRRGAADIRVAEHRIAFHAVAIDQRGAVDEQRPRLALLGCRLEPLEPARLIAILEQQQPERRLGVDVALGGGALEPCRCSANVRRNAAAEPISLAEVERRVGVAFLRKRPPDRDGGRIIGALPGFDPGSDVLRAQSGEAARPSNPKATKYL